MYNLLIYSSRIILSTVQITGDNGGAAPPVAGSDARDANLPSPVRKAAFAWIRKRLAANLHAHTLSRIPVETDRYLDINRASSDFSDRVKEIVIR